MQFLQTLAARRWQILQGLLPAPGDIVWIRQQRWRVERAWRDRHVVRLDVASRDRRMTFLSPFDRAIAPPRRHRAIRVRRQQAAARCASLIARAPDARVPISAIDARIELHPHQLGPVLAANSGHCRLLLADEVGLGKTIQAALVITEVSRRERGARVLVLAPSTLRDQWASELWSRFSVAATLADRVNLDVAARAGAFGDNPWLRPGVWIASPDFLKQRHVMDSLPADPWDLVVIDEAHVVCGDSDRFETCQAIARRARLLLLLTATPHSGDGIRFKRLTELGHHGDAASSNLVVFRRTRESLKMPVSRHVRWHFVNPSAAEVRALGALSVYERAVIAAAKGAVPSHALLLLSVLRKRALSTFAALSRTVSRRLGWLGDTSDDRALDWMQPVLAFDDLTDEAAEEERTALTAHTGLDAGKERSWLRRIRQLADEAAKSETKIARLTSMVCRTTEPVVIFTEYTDSLVTIRRRLHLSRSIATMTGSQDASERRANLKRFLEGNASVLLATDVASQGLNLQSRCRWVISLELPWNPARLEQRIGRIDRLGQTRTPHMTLLISKHPAESTLLAHISERVLSARRDFSSDSLSTLPNEASLAAALLQCAPSPPIAGTPPEPASTATIAPSTRWRRMEFAVARDLARRRRLAEHWRTSVDERGGPIWTSGTRNVALCSIPIRNGRDELVDELLVAARLGTAAPCSGDISAIADALTVAAARTIRRVVRKCIWRTSLRASRIIERERAVSRAIQEDEFPGEIQPGLFDRRSMTASIRDLSLSSRQMEVSERLIDRWREDRDVRAGAAVVEILWIARL